MVRALAEFDPIRALEVQRWPLREGVLAYIERLKLEAVAAWRHDLLCWSAIAPHSSKKIRAPKKPAILRGPHRSSEDEHR